MNFPLLSHNNHFGFGYDGDFHQINRSGQHQKFVAKYGSIERKLDDWRQANEMAARMIYARFGSRTVVCYSGGCDSEIALRSFFDQNLQVGVAILEMTNGLNSHDTKWAYEFLNKYNVKPATYILDVERYWNSPDFYNLVDSIQCVSPQLACHLWLCEQVVKNGGVPVIGQGEPYLQKIVPADYIPGKSIYDDSPWVYVESERLCSLYRYFFQQGNDGIPGFFQYIPEQTETFLRHSRYLHELTKNAVTGKLSTRTSKFQMLKEFYPDLTERPKYHGFENLAVMSDRLRQELALRFPNSDQNFYFSLDEIHRQLNGE